MPIFKLNRNHTLASVLGACVEFKKNEDTFAPEFLRKEIEALGGEEVGETTTEKQLDAGEPTGEARLGQINEALKAHALKKGGDKAPSVADLSKDVGFHVAADERDAAWEAFKKG